MHKQSFSDFVEKYFEEKAKAAQRYFDVTNGTLGGLGLSLGFACLGTSNSEGFAVLCLMVITIFWSQRIKSLEDDLEELKYVNHECMSFDNFIKNTYPALLSMIFLTSVATGTINTYGFSI